MTIVVSSYLLEDGVLSPIDKCTQKVKNPDYVEGSIKLLVNSVSVISPDLIDYVDQLWAYLADGLDVIREGGRWSTYFPDQPIEIILFHERVSGTVSLKLKAASLETRTATADAGEFFREVSISGAHFFSRMSVLSPSLQSHYKDLSRKMAQEVPPSAPEAEEPAR